jgi:hypothetical protein
MGLQAQWIENRKTKSQNLLGAAAALSREGFAVTRAEALNTGEIAIQCAYLGNVSSPRSEPVAK